MITAQRLSKVYAAGTPSQVVALHPTDLLVRAGEFVAIMGPSGSGKSTLMNLLGCLDRASAGTYHCQGRDTARLSTTELAVLRRNTIGFVFQQFNLMPKLSAIANVALPLVYAGVAPTQRTRLAQAALDRVGLGDRGHHRPSALSGGQQQRVAIARALINRPELLLADEPTGALDSRAGSDILDLFGELQAEGHTIVLITHDAAVAARAGRVLHIQDGHLTDTARGADANG